MKNELFIGLDVHKDSISIAIADEGRDSEVRYYGNINGDCDSLGKVIRKLISKNASLHFAYEAGPCGYQLYQHLTGKGYDCIVVAPSKIPQKSSDRIKNDRRDACKLARLHRAGELTPVYVPLPEDEAIRDLTRAREDAKKNETQAKNRISSFLLKHGIKYGGKSKKSKAYFRWLSDVKMPHPIQQIILQEYIDEYNECNSRVERLTDQVRRVVLEWRMAPVVQSLQALRGVCLITAATTIAEIGDLTRFEKPSDLMSYFGLVPSEHSSGGKVSRGSITKSGNGHVRRVLVESAWAYRLEPKVSRKLLMRQENLPKKVCDIAWKAQLRLCARYKKWLFMRFGWL
jgi:transposase